jgi:transposase
MKESCKLIKKLELLLKQLNCPRWLHHFGPKKYQLKHHLAALAAMEAYQLSLRRVEKMFVEILGIKVPTYSALCKRRKQIPSWIWHKILQITAGLEHENVAIDATGFSRSNPSHHYLVRIYRAGYRKAYAKLSMLYDIDKRKVIAIHVRAKPAHEIRDVKPLLGSYCKMQCLFADKAYDAEWLHEWCFDRGIQTVIPKKKNIHRGRFRKKQMINFSEEKYHQRSLIESGFSAIKRKYGGSVFGRSLSSIITELYCKAIAHNLSLRRLETFN